MAKRRPLFGVDPVKREIVRPIPSHEVKLRIWRADRLIGAYRIMRANLNSDGDDKAVLTDLLTDLMHYADQFGPDFDHCLKQARLRFDQEVLR